ncbi:hypothetical protein THAOC_25336 [Thalassiosira oceanica]|uniref:Uncharacterized protein n=1 Tax=Thalassiosira oceanica TaxID=159749 RepID=K0RRI3_THAOC|nr:hypothetical protein THAOC_25336 [Thalassiosira oceanica]|eukprot:EJK54989.1 hypothetical protein THAOC_25336 [Thalassiosira oceanica]
MDDVAKAPPQQTTKTPTALVARASPMNTLTRACGRLTWDDEEVRKNAPQIIVTHSKVGESISRELSIARVHEPKSKRWQSILNCSKADEESPLMTPL